MDNDFDQLLRDTLADLADEGHPVNLAAQAIHQGRRTRRRRRLALTGVCAALVALISLPFGVLHRLPGGPPTGSGQHHPGPAPSAEPHRSPTVHPTLSTSGQAARLPGGWILASLSAKGRQTIYDPAQHRYEQVSFSVAIPAPNSSVYAVQDTQALKVGIWDTAKREVRWLSGPPPASRVMDWSSDGSTLLYSARVSDTSVQAMIVTPAAEPVGPHAVTEPLTCAEKCNPHWLPDNTRIGFNRISPQGGWYFHVFRVDSKEHGDDTGEDMPLAGEVLSSHAWSADGRYVVVSGPAGRPWVADVRSGLAVSQVGEKAPADRAPVTAQPSYHRPTDSVSADQVYWTSSGTLLTIGTRFITHFGLDGTQLEVFPLPAQVTDDIYPAVCLARAVHQ